jgi:hypothetical protein
MGRREIAGFTLPPRETSATGIVVFKTLSPCSSAVEQRFRKPWVGGSIPPGGSLVAWESCGGARGVFSGR